MQKLRFVPARNPRHRVACFALCRALIREGRRIPIPEELSLSGQPSSLIRSLVIKGFKRNKSDTSPRLVFSALAAGYKFLSLFKEAQTATSKAHGEILEHLRSRQQLQIKGRERAQRRAEQNDQPATTRTTPQSPTEVRQKPPPLLNRHVSRDGEISYTRNLPPVPFSALKDGIRHIPRLYVTAEGVPFLRFKKPQPVSLSQAIRGLSRRNKATILKAKTLAEVTMAPAKQEDAWEKLVLEAAEEEGANTSDTHKKSDRQPSVKNNNLNGHANAVWDAWKWQSNKQNQQRLDGVARAEALVRIIEEEKRLREEEAPLRRELWAQRMKAAEQAVA